jgi:hypothetical protein
VRKSTIYLYVLGVAVVVLAALASAGLVVSAQNTNSMANMNMNTGAKTKPRRHKPKAASTGTGKCDPTKQEQTDLSGTYTGRVKHGDQPAIDATLTITGNNFTMTSGADSHSGRITAVTTCGYTAVTIMMGDLTPPTPGPNPPPPLPAMSLRAKKVGNSLTLTTVPGEPKMASFTTGGASMKAKPRRHRAKAKTGMPPPPPPKPKQ